MHGVAFSEEKLPQLFADFSATLKDLQNRYPTDQDIIGLWNGCRFSLAFTPNLVEQFQEYYQQQLSQNTGSTLTTQFAPTYNPAFITMSQWVAKSIDMLELPRPLPSSYIKNFCRQLVNLLEAKYKRHNLEQQYINSRRLITVTTDTPIR